MTTAAPYRPRLPDQDRLHAIAAEIGLWLCAFAAWLAEAGALLGFAMKGLRREALAEVRRATYDMEWVIFLLACRALPARAPVPAHLRRGRRPPGAPAGFRRTRDATGALRRVRRVFRAPGGALFGPGSLKRRIARLRDLIDNRALWIAQVVAHIGAGPHGAGLTPVAPAAAWCVAMVTIFAAEAADTS
jgi:hypothetical protein